MKKYLPFFVCALLLSFTTVTAQYVTIPDTSFRRQLIDKYPGCFNSAGQMDTTCSANVIENSLLISDVVYPWFDVILNPSWITNLDGLQYFKNLDTLGIYYSGITKLFFWPSKLKSLDIFSQRVDSIPSFPDSLSYFRCWPNFPSSYTSLPPLPRTLKHLEIMGCPNLLALPPLPQLLENLTINGGKWAFLPTLPSGLKRLDCTGNYTLKLLPPLPNSLEYLSTRDDSSLTVMPPLPGGLKELYLGGTSITCLPVLPNSLETLAYDRNFIRCLPNMNNKLVTQFTSNYPYTLPALCNATTNVYGCTAYPVITGYAFYDANSNGVKDANEFYKANNKLQLSNGNITFSNDSGYYDIGTTALGSYTLTPSNTFFNVLPVSKRVSFTSYDTTVFQNFAYQPTTVVDSMEVSITPMRLRVRPGRFFGYWIDAKNVGSGNFGATTIKFTYDNTKLNLDSATNPSFVHSGNVLTLNLTAFPIGARMRFIVYFTGKTTLALSDSLKASVNISSGTRSVSDSIISSVANSFDPNDKSATPRLSPSQVTAGKYIDYTIRYQNTGNDTAFNIVVTDTLSSQLQANTLEMISTSHQTKTTIIGNAVSFEMRNILLPDSNVNERKSHGFIRFRIKPKNTLVAGDSIKNKAAIYFDYNSPVITNNAITQIKNEGALPLKLISFKGNKSSEGTILLYWTTANEINTKTFVIEQSSDGRLFSAAGEKRANGFGNNSYNFSIANAPKIDLYFRLKMIDKDGAFTYSPIVLIKASTENAGFTLLQNPVSNELILTDISPSLLNTEAVLINNIGAVVKHVIIRGITQTVSVNDLPVGVYYLKTMQGNERVVVSR